MKVTEIINAAARRTGLMTDEGSHELEDMVLALNDVWLRAIVECRLTYRTPVTPITADMLYEQVSILDDDLNVIGFENGAPLDEPSQGIFTMDQICGDPIAMLYGVGLVRDDRYYDFEICSHNELIQMQISNRGSGNGQTVLCAPLGTDRLMFWPNLGVGDNVRSMFIPSFDNEIEYNPDDDFEPDYIPRHLHRDVLLAGTILNCLDKDQRQNDAEFWQGRYERGMAKLKLWAEEIMGEDTRMFVGQAGAQLVTWPDERSR